MMALQHFKTKGRFPILNHVAGWLFPAVLVITTRNATSTIVWTAVALGALIALDLFINRVINRGELVVGDDGVRVVGVRRSRFIAYNAITAVWVDADKEHITFELQDENEVRVHIKDVATAATELYQRLDQAVERGTTMPVLSLHRGGGFFAWQSRLRRLLMGRFREQTVTPELLIRVAEDPNATVDQRIGASVALADAPEPFRVRVRVAAGSVAQAEVGEAMRQAVEGALDEELAARLTKGS